MTYLAISCSGIDSVVGHVTLVAVMVKDEMFTKCRDYWNRNAMSLRLKRGILLKKLDIDLTNHMVRRSKNKEDVPRMVMDLMNSFKEFWKHPIYIDTPYGEEIVELIKEHKPKNLDIDLDNCKYRFRPHKSVTLAWGIAEEYKYQEEQMICKTWGNIGSNSMEDEVTKKFLEDNKDCPHVKDIYKINTGGKDGKEKNKSAKKTTY